MAECVGEEGVTNDQSSISEKMPVDRCLLCDATPDDIIECDANVILVRRDSRLHLAPRRHVVRWRDLSGTEQTALALQIGSAQELFNNPNAPVPVRLDETGGHVHLVLDPPRVSLGLLLQLPHDKPLISGGDDALHAHLRPLIDRASSVDLSVSFLMTSGVRLVLPHLQDLLDRGGSLRILTGDYLDVTEPAALRLVTDLEGARQVYIFRANAIPFHPKAWIFGFGDDTGALIVGSSNLSRSALTTGVEWNIRVFDHNGSASIHSARTAFEDLLARPEVAPLDTGWIDAYENRRILPTPKVTGTPTELVEESPAPHEVQTEALAALTGTRTKGYRAGMVVLATGLGKTFLAAFDSSSAKRILFVAHREEILTQAITTFRAVRPRASIGRYDGNERDTNADIVFASVQTLARVAHLGRFAADAFDYIVVDEFHHAAASTYRRIIEHFTPAFLLGLTATPDRSDGGDLLALCEENVVYECDLWSGIDRGILSPFKYFGVPDPVEYAQIPWRSGKFDEEALTAAVATQARAENALEQLALRGGKKTIGFCVSRRHADFMSEFAISKGLRAVAVHSGENSAPRSSALKALEQGLLDIVFAVDMFNEGVDVPSIDTVLMLRPTESPIIWLQQLGRGLRRSAGKTHLAVIDYIGNHRIFLTKVRTLMRLGTGDVALRVALEMLIANNFDFPTGCEVTYDLEAIDILLSLLRQSRDRDELIAFYRDFRERHRVRPTASQIEHAGFNPGRTGHAGWIGFVSDMGDLTGEQNAAWSEHKSVLDEIETMRMTRSYKMLVLRAMIDAKAFPGRMAIADLVERVARHARRNPRIAADLSVDPKDTGALRSLLLQQPLKILSETPFFQLENQTFLTAFEGTFAVTELARELVDWRLLRYLKSTVNSYEQDIDSQSPDGHAGASSSSTRPEALSLWQEYLREAIAPYFETAFNTGSWQTGIVTVKSSKAMILLVTMDKKNMAAGSQYTDSFENSTSFIWQSQKQTKQQSLHGRIISGTEPGWTIHLFIRKSKLRNGKAAPFRYAGPVRFVSWESEAPITVHWDLAEPLPRHLRGLYGLSDS